MSLSNLERFMQPLLLVDPFHQFGGDDRDRTGDLLLAKQMLSQLSYIPSAFNYQPAHS